MSLALRFVPTWDDKARLAGDFNPLHHDEEFAKSTHFSKRDVSVGLEFTLRFQGPVRPGERPEMVWDVVDVTSKPKRNGEWMSRHGDDFALRISGMRA